MTIEFKDIPDPSDGSLKAMVQRRWIVIRFLATSSGMMRDPIVALTLIASFARSGLIFSINETARMGGGLSTWPVSLLLICALTMLTAAYYQRMRAFLLVTSVARQLRERMSKQLLRANIDFLLSQKHGQVYSAMTGEVNGLSSTVVAIVEIVGAFIVLAFALPYLFYVSPESGTAALVAVMIGVTGFVLLDRPARKWGHEAARLFAEYCDRVGDMLGGWKELRLRRARRDALEAETLGLIDDHVGARMHAQRLFAASAGVGQAAIILLLCFVVIALPALRNADATVLFQVLTIIFLVNTPIETLFNALPALSQSETAYFRILTVDRALAGAQSQAMVDSTDVKRSFSEIALVNVEARLGDADAADAEPFDLGPVNLTFHPGETVFVCGGNGSGKTTLLSLITGLRNPTRGDVQLDGHPLTKQTTGAYRELFSGVFSGFHLFERAYGFSDQELAALEEHIDRLDLRGRVSMLDDKFSSTSLSAGQSRRLALAVALAEQRPIIVLDEFAADQDPANRAFFYDVLVPELSGSGRLVLAVTHDDHQFHKCDRLIKMAGGQIVSDERMAATRVEQA
ncbi:putative ATP-binding cassette transporter [Shimia isoporae]|uniref:Putative ATP-binding cassette transporter n=1 Tax=Shimia isoporae TaxID=647720 RepID=A0A4R1N4E5_9RHOB|nr:cyclic peptide export ABC transporter [Shimia isoporae]TCL01536.1 putative ATP-binding cassette transporter [Shimia isoporae]